MNSAISKNKLFIAACISLIVTAMTFAIRAGILGQLGEDFEINNTQLGFVNAMAFWGFPVATIFGGFLYNLLGAKKLMTIAFFSHIVGLIMTIYAGGFATLLISSFLSPCRRSDHKKMWVSLLPILLKMVILVCRHQNEHNE